MDDSGHRRDMAPPYPHLGRTLLAAGIIALFMNGCGIGPSYIRPGEPHPVRHAAKLRTTSPGATGTDGTARDDPGRPVYTVYLLGDAGYADAMNSAPLDAVEREAAESPGHSLVVFLGDNVYSDGMPAEGEPGRERAEGILTRQLDVIGRSGAKGLFIPGNHDWNGMGEGGPGRIVAQQEFIEEYANTHPGARVDFLPRDAQPGPALAADTDVFRIITIDSQWWLHGFQKPLYPGAATVAETESLAVDSLRRLTEGYDGVVLLLAHNPLETYGPHGGFFTWKEHIFPLTQIEPWLWLPLPGLGSLYPVARANGISPQDLSNGTYGRYVTNVRSALGETTPVLIASGHEHALQVIHSGGNILSLVSGSAILDHSSAVTDGDNTLFASELAGYMVLHFYVDGSVRLRVMGLRDAASPPEVLFTRLLVDPAGAGE